VEVLEILLQKHQLMSMIHDLEEKKLLMTKEQEK
jgi:hypothetical protein